MAGWRPARENGCMTSVSGLTIGQLVASAGVTVRAARHYHHGVLLPEPERDASRYRRDDARAVIALMRIKRFADAGVPLARIQDLLDTPPEQFGTAVEALDALLAGRIAEFTAARARLRAPAAAGGGTLAEPVAAHIERPHASDSRMNKTSRHRPGRMDAPQRALRLSRSSWNFAGE